MNIFDVAEYNVDGAGLVLSKGSTEYFSTVVLGDPKPFGIAITLSSPYLWLGALVLT